MKRIVIISIAALMAGVFAGCNSKPQAQAESADVAGEQAVGQKPAAEHKCCFAFLNDEQKAKLHALREANEVLVAPIRQALQANDEQLRAHLQAQTVNLDSINALIDQTFALKASMRKVNVAMMVELCKTLEPEQRQAVIDRLMDNQIECNHQQPGEHCE